MNDYTDPARQVHEQQALRRAPRTSGLAQWSSLPPLDEPVNPLADLPQAQYEIFSSAFPARREPIVRDAIIGAVIGGLLGRWLDKRQARKQAERERVMRSLGIHP